MMRICDLVISKTGSDAEKAYLVVGFTKSGYCLLVDGRRHPLSAPKKKNTAHVTAVGVAVKALPKTDAAVVTAIRRLMPSKKI